MASVSTTVRRIERVVLIEAVIQTAAPLRVELKATVDGPVHSPRTDGAPVWEGGTTTCRVDAAPVAVGFATVAPLETHRPIEIVDSVALSPYGDVPDGVAAWLDRVEGRLDRAEAITPIEDLPTATAAVSEEGGLAAIERLVADLRRDERLLSRLTVAPGLRERIEKIDVPLSTLRRIAR